ncbi:hypothetical protein [Luteibacter sp. 22Crub2.1]|uniref:hypothetical protein n=1 Tax=Luteibacter sp. 22Crub2.1 TaxID=1283288 RepID=UPI0009A888C0|nr:hypothetical protein [Luteibacter sp. 22Crub2.1]SKB74136.1 hypothetical protein SAMN05660880_02386 [Luteibacter sp. 22Crub2.1]
MANANPVLTATYDFLDALERDDWFTARRHCHAVRDRARACGDLAVSAAAQAVVKALSATAQDDAAARGRTDAVARLARAVAACMEPDGEGRG